MTWVLLILGSRSEEQGEHGRESGGRANKKAHYQAGHMWYQVTVLPDSWDVLLRDYKNNYFSSQSFQEKKEGEFIH